MYACAYGIIGSTWFASSFAFQMTLGTAARLFSSPGVNGADARPIVPGRTRSRQNSSADTPGSRDDQFSTIQKPEIAADRRSTAHYSSSHLYQSTLRACGVCCDLVRWPRVVARGPLVGGTQPAGTAIRLRSTCRRC